MVSECDADQNDPYKQTLPTQYCYQGNCSIGFGWPEKPLLTTAHGINGGAGYMAGGVESCHPGGAEFLFCDGHVAFLSERIDQATLVALTTRNRGEVINGSDY